MKKTFTILLLLIACKLQAQQTFTDSLETWRNYFAMSPFGTGAITSVPLTCPKYWRSLDSFSTAFGKGSNTAGTFVPMVYKVPGHTGNAAVMVISRYLDTIGFGFGGKPTPNVLTNGEFDLTTGNINFIGGTDWFTKLKAIKFWVKNDIRGNDVTNVKANLVDDGDANNITFAEADTIFTTSNTTWQQATVNFKYTDSSLTPTLLRLFIGSSKLDATTGFVAVTDSTSIIIDDIELVYATGITQPFYNYHIAVYPTTVAKHIFVESSVLKNCIISIFSADGKKVSSYNLIAGNNILDIANVTTGNYYYQITNAKQHILQQGKFIKE